MTPAMPPRFASFREPRPFRHPRYSLRGDFTMLREVLPRRLRR